MGDKAKKKSTVAKPPVVTTHNNDIKIIGDNVLYNNGIITAYYILPLTNYSTASYSGVEATVQNITNLITNLTISNPELTFSIERISKTVRAKDVRNNLIDTINIYNPDFDMPPEFYKNIRDSVNEYCLLGIDIQQSTITEVDDFTLLDTAKTLFGQVINTFTGLGNLNADPEQILRLENNIYRAIKNSCLRATKELVFYNYVSKVFPCYEISYDQMSFINENNYEKIMGNVSQTVSDAFGSFTMQNDGVDIFDLPVQETYGCMIDIKSFPLKIDSVTFPMDFPNLITNIQCLKKEDASLKLKRTRAMDTYDLTQAEEGGAEIEQLETISNNIQIASRAISEIDNEGAILCQFNTSILVTSSESLEDLRSKITNVITACKDRDILASKSLTQALDFLDHYINNKPKKYIHMANLSYPLSFQQNAGATVGDTESDINPITGKQIWSPSIGEDIG